MDTRFAGIVSLFIATPVTLAQSPRDRCLIHSISRSIVRCWPQFPRTGHIRVGESFAQAGYYPLNGGDTL